MKIIKKLFLSLLLLLFGSVLVGFGYYFAVTKETRLYPEKLLFNEQTLAIYDRDNALVSSGLDGLFKQNTPSRDIPEHVKQAFIDTEDKRFYSHGGYDLRRIVSASWRNLKAGRFKEGASTISQQLIKNTHLTQEKTLKRKLREFKLTRELEKRYSKEEILERYLNTIYFGHGCFGITSAAEFYFNKTPNELSLADGAILAGLVKSPNHYSPFKNPDACQKRKAIVLRAMQKNGHLEESDLTIALESPLPLPATTKTRGYASFVFDELTAIAEEKGLKIGGKIEIYTYLDPSLQTATEEIASGYRESDKTLLVLDGETHGFKACVSTLGNRPRLPGSLIKPLLVYTPAIAEDILTPATPILDEKVNYGGYAPENYDGKYHGYVSARECVEKSLNIPAVKTLESLTLKKGVSYLEKMGLRVNEEDKSLALALGGMKEGYTLKELVNAYCTLSSGGVYEEGGFISTVKINGITVYKRSTRSTRVFDEASAYLATDMLKGTATQGTAKKLRSLPFEIAAKTGTVGTKKGNVDAYALSYTTRDVAAVWLGNANNDEIPHTGGGAPCNLLYQINQALFAEYEREGKRIAPFPPCDSVQKIELDKDAYYDTHTILLADELSPLSSRFSELFKSSAIPLKRCDSYSNPRICAPTLTLVDGRVELHFADSCPAYYSYKIERYDYATHTTLYEGELLPVFIDDTLQKDRTYYYVVTPSYKGRIGEGVSLPAVTTKQEKNIPKEWWEY